MLKLSNLKLSSKFGVTMLLLLILPISIVAIVVGGVVSAYDFKQACAARQELLGQIGTGVENFTRDMEYLSKNILSNKSVQNLLKEYRNPSLNSVSRQTLAAGFSAQDLLDSRNFIKAVSLSDQFGIIYQYGLRVYQEDDSYITRVEERSGSPFWTAAYRQKYPTDYYRKYLDGEYVVSLMRMVNDLTQLGRSLGMERITVDETYLESIYAGLKSPEGVMYLFDGEGNIVSSTDKSMLGTNLSGDESFSGLTGQGRFAKAGKVYFYQTIPGTQWTLVWAEPRSVFLTGQREVFGLTTVNILIILLFGTVFMIVQYKSIIWPVSSLSREVQDYREGNFKISTHTTCRDEIGQLNTALQKMSDYISNLIEREYKSKLTEREMELEYLHMQINPHFLYNTLDSIRWMAVMEDQPKIAECLEAMSGLFRHSLNRGEKYTTFREEIKNLERYLILQKMRFPDTLEFEIAADPDILDCKVIKLLIQPLVENAVVHGIEPKRGGGRIIVTIEKSHGKICCRVEDNGVGIDVEAVRAFLDGSDETHKAFALKNIQDRLRLEYGGDYGIHISGRRNEGTTIWVYLPMIYVCGEDEEYETFDRG